MKNKNRCRDRENQLETVHSGNEDKQSRNNDREKRNKKQTQLFILDSKETKADRVQSLLLGNCHKKPKPKATVSTLYCKRLRAEDKRPSFLSIPLNYSVIAWLMCFASFSYCWVYLVYGIPQTSY